MKTRHIIITILCSLSTGLKAATVGNGYHPMLIEGKVWNYTYHSDSGDLRMHIEEKGDTVVNKNKCHKLYLCLPDCRYLYGCYYEDEEGHVSAYIKLDIQKKDGKLVIQPLETASPSKSIYSFKPSGSSWTFAWGNASDVNWMSNIVIGRSAKYNKSASGQYPLLASPARYELITVNGNRLARVRMTDFQRHDELETWVSGVGERYWGIMLPIQGVGKDDGGEWMEFESCEEDGHQLLTKTDFDMDAQQQDYRPFVEDNKTWTCSTNPYGADIYYYHLKGDTLIDNQQCLKLYSQNRYNDGKTRYEGALYEKGKRVFWYRPSDTDRSLLYDFSLTQGEEAMLQQFYLPNMPEEADSSGICAITDVYELNHDQLLHMILFYEVDRYGDRKTEYHSRLGCWIEGVGPSDMMDVLDNTGFNIAGDGYGSGIIDCSVNGKSVYRKDEYEQLMNASSIRQSCHKENMSRTLYDLQGRRLNNKSTKGVYIENGRKVVVK